MKKVLSLVLVLTLVLGSFGMVFAAGPTDVAGHKAETSVNVLVNMGIIDGYPDGTYKPEGIVTRAEMAKILVTALGLGKMVPSTTSSFTDMAGHWADGYVAYAASLGMIVGYPDGTFKPDATVSYEEAATMMVRALGYDDRALIGTWPGNYVSKALALGLYKNVSVAAGGANRGDIALMIYELLDETMGKVTDDGKVFTPTVGETMLKIHGATPKEVAGGTLMEPASSLVTGALIDMTDYIGHYVNYYVNKDGKVIAVTKVHSDELTGKIDTTVAPGKLVVDGREYTLDFAAAARNFYGTTAVADQRVPGNNFYKNGSIKNPVVVAVAQTASLTVAASNKATATVIGEISGNKIFVDSLIIWQAEETRMIDNGDLADIEDVLAGKTKTLFSEKLSQDSAEKLTLNKIQFLGDAKNLAEIKKDDIVTFYLDKDNEIIRIATSRKIEEGTVTKNTNTAVAGGKITINGNVYEVDNSAANVVQSLDSTHGDLTPGTKVKAYIGANGKIVKVTKLASASADEYAMVVAFNKGFVGTSVAPTLKVLTKDNEMLTIKVDTAAKVTLLAGGASKNLLQDSNGTATVGGDWEINTAANVDALDAAAVDVEIIPGTIITYDTKSNGDIDEVVVEQVFSAAGTTYVANQRYNSRTNEFASRDIADNVVVFKYNTTKIGDSKAVAMSDIKDASTGVGAGVFSSYVYDATDKEVVAIVIHDTAAKVTTKFAVVNGNNKVYSEADDVAVDELTVLTADGSVAYMAKKGYDADTLNTGNLAIVKGDLIKIALDGGRLSTGTGQKAADAFDATMTLADMKTAYNVKTGANLDTLITAVNSDNNRFTLEVGGNVEYADNATVFYVAKFDSNDKFDGWELGSDSDLRIGALAIAFDLNDDAEDEVNVTTDTLVEVVLIVKKADIDKDSF